MCDKKKGISQAAHEAAEALKKLGELAKESDVTPKLLTIELDDLNSVPVVHYKGEELGPKTELDFSWSTKTLDDPGHIAFDVEHFAKGGGLEKQGFRGKGYYISSEQKGYLDGGSVPVPELKEIGEAEPIKGLSCNIEISGMDLIDMIFDHIDKRIVESKINGS